MNAKTWLLKEKKQEILEESVGIMNESLSPGFTGSSNLLDITPTEKRSDVLLTFLLLCPYFESRYIHIFSKNAGKNLNKLLDQNYKVVTKSNILSRLPTGSILFQTPIV